MKVFEFQHTPGCVCICLYFPRVYLLLNECSIVCNPTTHTHTPFPTHQTHTHTHTHTHFSAHHMHTLTHTHTHKHTHTLIILLLLLLFPIKIKYLIGYDDDDSLAALRNALFKLFEAPST